MPALSERPPLLDADQTSLALQLCVQAAQKYALTEGERVVLSAQALLTKLGVVAVLVSSRSAFV